jgi:hypothetical protein
MKKISMMTALLCSVAAIGFENSTGWKMDGDKLALDSDGNPIFVGADGREMSVKGDTITGLQGEAKRNREAKESAESKLAKFDGITDVDAAKKAIETVSKLDAKQLIDAGKVDEVKAQITAQFQEQLNERDASLAKANSTLDTMRIDNAFSASEFMRERVAVPSEMLRATFQDRFKVEDGKVVAYGADGNPISSKKHIGENANFDEALELIIDNYKHKDSILKAADAGGSGSGGAGGARGRGRTMTRSQFEALDPAAQQEFAGKMGTGEAALVD